MKAKDKILKLTRWNQLPSCDFWIIILVSILTIIGIIMVFSASYYRAISYYGTPYYFLKRNLVFALIGCVLMYIMSVVDYHIIRKYAYVLLLIGAGLLVLVLGIGSNINGATRWIAVGPITLMPGEIAKVCAIAFVARWFSEKPERIKSFTQGVIPMAGLVAVYCGLIMLQPNLSTAMTIALIIAAMMFLAGLHWLYYVAMIGVGAVGFVALRMAPNFWGTRIESWLHPFKYAASGSFQIVQSLLALGTGGLFGLGLGKSVQKNLYLPEPQNDYILAIIGEEVGFLGVFLLLAIFALLVWRGLHIAMNAPDLFGMLVAGGIALMIGIQVVLNVAVVTNSVPPTGIALPFISYGGNALWICMGSSGVLLNISRYCNKEGHKIAKEKTMSRVERVRARNKREEFI